MTPRGLNKIYTHQKTFRPITEYFLPQQPFLKRYIALCRPRPQCKSAADNAICANHPKAGRSVPIASSRVQRAHKVYYYPYYDKYQSIDVRCGSCPNRAIKNQKHYMTI